MSYSKCGELFGREDAPARPKEEIPAEAKEGIKELTSKMRDLRHELKVVGEIWERSGHVRENLEIIDKDRQREKER